MTKDDFNWSDTERGRERSLTYTRSRTERVRNLSLGVVSPVTEGSRRRTYRMAPNRMRDDEVGRGLSIVYVLSVIVPG